MNPRVWTIVLFVALGALYFGSLDKMSLTDPDEVFYSETAREMMQERSYVTPLIFGQPQFEKPPLFYWLLIGTFKVLGPGAFAARLVPALCGFLGLLATFFFCRRVFNEEIAWLAVILMGTSALYLSMSKAVLTDITLSVLIAAGFYAFYLWFLERRDSYLYAFALAAALAVLTKGPIAIIIMGMTAVLFLAVGKDFKLIQKFLVHPWVVVFIVVCAPWYADIIARHGRVFVDEFIVHDNWDRILYAEHKNFDHWWFYPMVLTAGLFPWTFYLMMAGRWWNEYRRECLFFLIWLVVTFLIFQRAHSKLASYILPALPAVIIPLSISVSSLSWRSKRSAALAVLYVLLGVGFLIAPSLVPHKYEDFLWPAAVIGIRVFGVALISGAVLLWQGRLMQAIATKAAGLTIMFFLIGMYIPSPIDRMAANGYIADIVAKEHYQGPILTNKHFARGVYFYTGQPVTVLDQNKQPFWSPHPIKVISTVEEIRDFFEDKPRVLCVIKPSYLHDLDQALGSRRKNRILTKDSVKMVLMSEKI
jgi:4-amino-4-deoxy-L-arabinose transferase-like glycosyltransferase